MTRAELGELREAWARAVLMDGPWLYAVPTYGRPMPCFFDPILGPLCAEDDFGPCEGRMEGAHWIKRQTVERWMRGRVTEIECPECGALAEGCGRCGEIGWLALPPEHSDDLAVLAAWDPRNGVPACERHHRIFDSQRVPLPSEQIVIFREQVPAHVEAFARDWGLEHELERKHQPMGAGI